ncbi:MAG: VWA domain-containing protein, partial [Lentisphaerales bacterium]|nr:VWA domain-containing protein [Lentisphaerales bacterium]
MSDFTFLNFKMIWFMPLLVAFVFLHFYRERKRRQDLDGFTKGHTRLAILRWPQLVFICLSIFFLVFALMQPAWNKKPKTLLKEGRDLVFILDVSNSMLAEDVIPNRLERSKIAISECIDTLVNHRVGLVVFAGSATIKCPLTLDYGFFNTMLTKVGPNSAAQGGTRVADAILKTCDKLFSDSKKGYKDIILISDGGDQGKTLQKAVETLNDQNIKLIGIGVGDERNGARIPHGEGFMTYKGKEVWTKLDSAQLQKLVKECKKGAYLPAGTAQIDLGRIYEQLTANDETMEMGEQSVMVYEEEYPTFIFISF